jgi:hypothetical protein
LKAILSQFTPKKKASDDDTEADSDGEDQEDIYGDEVEEDDGVDADREASDELLLEEIAHEVAEVHVLSVAEDKLGRSAIKKV